MTPELHHAIRYARRDADLTSEQLARVVGVSLRTVMRWQSGDDRPSLENRLKIARACGMLDGAFEVAA